MVKYMIYDKDCHHFCVYEKTLSKGFLEPKIELLIASKDSRDAIEVLQK